ncbi:hypothetical protein CC78DRAFT_590659 [Lojkania enalia]|uniref:DUF7888 domain-containing protein n=1 Tax=Lojkania enalia TaxID=147567 RepID=A0A9P4K263_9PLEO|nr:hypothetical protein CC78DRAFT_590659 [Didymosphaeria enalia]
MKFHAISVLLYFFSFTSSALGRVITTSEAVSSASESIRIRESSEISAAARVDGKHLVEWTAKLVDTIIKAVRELENKKKRSFTTSWVSQARREYPEHNALCVHGDWEHSFVDYTQEHVELKLDPAGVRTYGYDCFVFVSGGFHRKGDGGYENWAYSGLADRNDNRVEFFRIESPPSEAQAPETPPVVNPDPIRSTPDGVYLVNCKKDGMVSSGVAYYKNLRDSGNWGQQPDDYVDVTHGWLTNWERSGWVVFPSTNTLFSWSIVSDGQGLQDYQRAGNAANRYVNFNVYKDKEAELYVRDGWHCNSMYWAY